MGNHSSHPKSMKGRHAAVAGGLPNADAATKASSTENLRVEPSTELDNGKTWIVAHYCEQEEPIVLPEATMRQTVRIDKCRNVTVQIADKVNSISINECKNVKVFLTSLIGNMDIISCEKVKVDFKENCPSFNIDSSDCVTVYLPETNSNVKMASAKSCEMNLIVVKEDGDSVEIPIPEQFQHHLSPDLKMISRASDLYR